MNFIKEAAVWSIDLYELNACTHKAAVSMLADTGKAAVIHPTGTGKSFIGFKRCEDNPDSMIVCHSPSEYIYKTQLEDLVVTGAEVSVNIQGYTYASNGAMTALALAETTDALTSQMSMKDISNFVYAGIDDVIVVNSGRTTIEDSE